MPNFPGVLHKSSKTLWIYAEDQDVVIMAVTQR